MRKMQDLKSGRHDSNCSFPLKQLCDLGKVVTGFELHVLVVEIRVVTVMLAFQGCFIGNNGVWHVAVTYKKEATIYNYFPTVTALQLEITGNTPIVK